jgi:hypothetical protein
MFLPGDKILKEYTRAMRRAERQHPERDWRYGLSKKKIRSLQEDGVMVDDVWPGDLPIRPPEEREK